MYIAGYPDERLVQVPLHLVRLPYRTWLLGEGNVKSVMIDAKKTGRRNRVDSAVLVEINLCASEIYTSITLMFISHQDITLNSTISSLTISQCPSLQLLRRGAASRPFAKLHRDHRFVEYR